MGCRQNGALNGRNAKTAVLEFRLPDSRTGKIPESVRCCFAGAKVHCRAAVGKDVQCFQVAMVLLKERTAFVGR